MIRCWFEHAILVRLTGNVIKVLSACGARSPFQQPMCRNWRAKQGGR